MSETCEAIYLSLKDVYLKSPTTHEQWENISFMFEELWNFPHVLGAIDGKHIQIESTGNSGAFYHNYKGFFNFVLLEVCGVDYCFSTFDLGEYGSNNDSRVKS